MGLRILRWLYVFGFGRLVCVCICSSPSQNEANIDDTFVQKSTENQVGFGMVLADTEVVLDCSWGLKGGPGKTIFGLLGHPWTSFWGLGVALGAHFGVLGVPLDAFGAQSSPRTASPG